MTVRDMRETVCDREFFPDRNQEVLFKFGDLVLKVKGTTVPEKGPAVVELTPVPLKKFMFSLKFEANPVIEAMSLEEAEAKAWDMLNHAVVRHSVAEGDVLEEFVAQEPCLLEEIKA